MYQLKETANQLGKLINLYADKTERQYHRQELDFLEESKWAASHLYATILIHSKETDLFWINSEKLKKIKDTFCNDTGSKIDIDLLIQKDWIRIVYDIVHIASVPRSGLHNLEKLIEIKNEFNFLLKATQELIKEKNGEFNKLAFEEYLKNYQLVSGITLDLNKTVEFRMCIFNEETVKISNVSYYKPIIDNLEDFQFLDHLYSLMFKDEGSNGIYIEEKLLNEIIESHRKIFPETPDANAFIKSGQIKLINEQLLIELWQGDRTSDRTSALLWEKLIADNTFSDDEARMRFWYNRIMHRENHWCNIGKNCTEESLKRFIEIAVKIILNDSDLASGSREFQKLWLDQRQAGLDILVYFKNLEKEIQFPESDDLFELYRSLCTLDYDHQGELLYMQEARMPLFYFIWKIVLNDPAKNDGKNIFALLASSATKPFILFKVCMTLREHKPGLITVLFLNKTTISLGLDLLNKLKISTTLNDGLFMIRQEILEKAFTLVIKAIDKISCTEEEKSTIIFQCLLTSSVKKFRRPEGQDIIQQEKQKEHTRNVDLSLRNIFFHCSLPGIYYSGSSRQMPHLFPGFISYILNSVTDWEDYHPRQFNSLELPYVKLDFYAWLLSLTLSPENNMNGDQKDEVIYKICETFTELFLETINCQKIDGYDFEKDEYKKIQPSWYFNKYFDSLIDWDEVLLILEEQNFAEDFINSKHLTLIKASDRYNKYNRFTAEKIRTHLSILITCFNRLYGKQSKLFAKSNTVKSLLDKLELKITFYITTFSVDDTLKKRIDIFDSHFERSFAVNERVELFPEVGFTMNRFNTNNKRKILAELTKVHQLARSLKLLEYARSEQDQQILLPVINSHKITDYLEALYSVNDVQFVMEELAKSEIFFDKAKEALSYWDRKILKGRREDMNEFIITAYRIRLMIAYHSGEEKNINAVELPVFKYPPSEKSFSPLKEKEFYQALIFFKNKDYKKAYEIFDEQLKGYDQDRPTLALNRFAAKLQWADETKDPTEQKTRYTEAVEEWNVFESKLGKNVSIQFINEKVWYNKLHAFSKLKDDSAFDLVYTALERTLQLRKDFLELKVTNLIQRNMQGQAEKIHLEAEDYHRLSDGSLPDFIFTIKKIIEAVDPLLELQQYYNRIFSKSPEELIKIIPDNLNPFNTLPEFILSEIVSAGNGMLTYINSIREVHKEDKYSDLMVLALNSRLRIYQWHIGNARGGYSDAYKPNPGEIDFAIYSPKEKLTICEAMILTGKNTALTQKHLFKVFNYDHTRKHLFIIVYYQGKRNKFEYYWETYKKTVSTIIKFPKEFLLKGKVLQDKTKKFGNDSMKVAEGKHYGNVTLFHIFININYRVTK